MQDCLHLRNAAARGVRRESAHEPCRKGRGGPAAGEEEQQAQQARALRPGDQLVPELVRLKERQPEGRAEEPCKPTNEQGEPAQFQEIPPDLISTLPILFVVAHRH